MSETKGFCVCIKTHKMSSGEISHTKGGIYPYTEENGNYYTVLNAGCGDSADIRIDHSMTESSYFHEYFSPIKSLTQFEDVMKGLRGGSFDFGGSWHIDSTSKGEVKIEFGGSDYRLSKRDVSNMLHALNSVSRK